MDNDYKLKISAKGSRRTGDEFIQETTYLAEIVDCIEIDFNFPHDRNFEVEMKFLKKLAIERNIKYTVHAQYLNGSINDFNQKVRQATLDELYRNIDAAKELGAKVITLHPALEPYGLKLKKRNELEIEAYCELANYALKKQISIGLENEAQTCFWFPDRACKFELLEQTINIVAKPNFGFTLDFGHASVSGEDYISAIKKLGHRILHIHAHDNLGGTENNLNKFNRPDPHLAPGKGIIQWKNVINALRAINYQGYFELECEVHEIKEAVKYISSL
jgi:sugar phosphate isomerase/epimerase